MLVFRSPCIENDNGVFTPSGLPDGDQIKRVLGADELEGAAGWRHAAGQRFKEGLRGGGGGASGGWRVTGKSAPHALATRARVPSTHSHAARERVRKSDSERASKREREREIACRQAQPLENPKFHTLGFGGLPGATTLRVGVWGTICSRVPASSSERAGASLMIRNWTEAGLNLRINWTYVPATHP